MTTIVKECGQRVRLAEWRVTDLDAMHRWNGDPRVTQHLDWGSETLAESQQHLDLCISSQSECPRVRFFFAVELIAEKRIIGDAGFQWASDTPKKRIAEMGYFIEAKYWGNGLGAEAAGLVLTHAFTIENADEVRASCDVENRHSERVMQKCGMQICNNSTTQSRKHYRITRGEWNP
jgi:ribosomal-protein-alanine N-acetyltransferase